MIPFASALAVAAITFSLAIAPGPNMVYLISRSLTQGRRAGLISLVGVACGFFVYLVATALGLATLFAAVPTLFTIVKLAGATYLLYLAWTMLRPGGRDIFIRDGAVSHSSRRLYVMGLTTCLLNPKVALVYMALLPQFVDPALPTVPQLLQLGMVQIVVSVSVNTGWALSAASLARLLQNRPVAQRVQRWVSGSLLGIFAVQLLASPNQP